MNMASADASIRVEPVFFKNSDVLIEDNRWLTVYEICNACSLVVHTEKEKAEKKKNPVEGAQKIGDLWRIYLNDELARVKLLSHGITLRGQQIDLKERNPFIIVGFEHIPTTRLFIRNIPLSFDNGEILDALKSLDIEMVNTLKDARARDPDGKLTNFKTGDRFVDIVVPDEPLPKKLKISIFTASLYHKEQKNSEKECGNCMMKGHLRKDCPNEIVCYQCRNAGHKRGDPECPSVIENEAEALDDGKENDIVENDDVDSVNGHESEEETDKEERRVSQMLKEALTAAEGSKSSQAKELATPKTSAQTLMDAFVSSNVQTSKSDSRTMSCSPAGRRKIADRSPDIDFDLKKKDKKNKKK